MIFSRFLVSDTRRVSIPPRWLSDLARRTFPFSPAGQGPFKHRRIHGKHLQRNVLARRQTLEELAAEAAKEYAQVEMRRQVLELIERFKDVQSRVPR